jgi:hypothetical protein
MLSIIFSIDTNEDGYTNDSDDEQYIPALVKRIAYEVTEYMDYHYPFVSFETRFVPETLSYGNRTRSYGDTYDEERIAEGIVEELDSFVSNNWTDWYDEISAESVK